MKAQRQASVGKGLMRPRSPRLRPAGSRGPRAVWAQGLQGGMDTGGGPCFRARPASWPRPVRSMLGNPKRSGETWVNASPSSPSTQSARRLLRQTREDRRKGLSHRLSVHRPDFRVPVFALTSCPPIRLCPGAGPLARGESRHPLQASRPETAPLTWVVWDGRQWPARGFLWFAWGLSSVRFSLRSLCSKIYLSGGSRVCGGFL